MCEKILTSGRVLRAIPHAAVAVILVGALGQLGGADRALAAAPVIDDLSASRLLVQPGETVSLALDAHDPDCAGTCTDGCGQYIRADLTSWTPTDGAIVNESNGESGSPYSASADWQAPDAEGVYTISVYVADSGSFLCGGRESVTPSLDIQVSLSSNEPPVVTSLTADKLLGFPGEQSSLTCLASDPEGDPILYSWQSDAGAVTDLGDGVAVLALVTPGIVTVTCTATDPQGAFGSNSIGISVSGAQAERTVTDGLRAPAKLSVTSWGDVYVVDGSAAGLTVVNLLTGKLAYRLPLESVAAVDIDWNDDLLVGGTDGAEVLDRAGTTRLALQGSTDDVVDVAVDKVNRRYGVLYRGSGRIEIFDESGAPILAFGSSGDDSDQFLSAHGLAATPTGGGWPSVHWVVADTGHGLIKVFDSQGQWVDSYGGLGAGAGEFVQLSDVAVDRNGVIYASDSFQSWVQAFGPDGAPRETLGSHGFGLGQFKTAAGIAVADPFDRVVASSLNGASLQIFATTAAPVGEGPTPKLAISPPELDFGQQLIGDVSASMTVTISNTGAAPLGIHRLAVDGPFAHSSDCGPYLEAGESCTVEVTFQAQVAGPVGGSLQVETGAPQGSVTVPLSGYGLALPSLEVLPLQIDFAEQEVGTLSTPKLVQLRNAGAVPVTLAAIVLSGEFQLSHQCPDVLAAAATCSVEIYFAPAGAAGPRSGLVSVVSDAPGGSQEVGLTGTAIAPVLRIGIAGVTVDEGDEADPAVEAIFEITLSLPSDGTVSVDYQTRDGSATQNEDYEPQSGTLLFADGETLGTIAVPVLGDQVLEPEEEDFLIDLSAPIHSEIEAGTATAVIVDNEICPGPNMLGNPDLLVDPGAQSIPDWTLVAPTEYTQQVDLTAFATPITDGLQQFSFSAWVSSDDAAVTPPRVVVDYLDALTSEVLETFDSGDIPIAANWQEIADSRWLHPYTGAIRVRLFSSFDNPAEAAAQFDQIELSSVRTPTLSLFDIDDYEGDEGSRSEWPFALQLACPYYQEATIAFETVDETALAGEDYIATSGLAALPIGDLQTDIPVTIFGDAEDEDHETFSIALSGPFPSAVILIDDEAVGFIVNDDFCPLRANFWLRNTDLWPVSQLELGGVTYSQAQLLIILQYTSRDMSEILAKQLTATKLDLAMGSPPDIVPTVIAADDFLVQYPPGSNPRGLDRRTARDLKQELFLYNTQPCP